MPNDQAGSDPPTFSLTRQPWITCLTTDNEVRDYSLVGVFREAPRIKEVVGELPTQSIAILRLLLAILHRTLGGPATIENWAQANDHWQGTVGQVSEYLDTFSDRFDLRHPEHPFMQVAGLASPKGEVSSLERIVADGSADKPFQYTRTKGGLERISWAEAARWLIHAHAWDVSGIKTGVIGDPRSNGGKIYPEGTGWLGKIGAIWAQGDTLKDTLLLNLIATTAISGLTTGDEDEPFWEREPLGVGTDPSLSLDKDWGVYPRGFIDLYTWQSRRVRLVGDDEDVTGVVLTYGDRMLPQNRQPYEPGTAWRYSDPQTRKFKTTVYMPQEFYADRQAWRGLQSILPHAPVENTKNGVPKSQPPALLEWLEHLNLRGHTDQQLVNLRICGVQYGAQQSTFAEIIDDAFALPLAVIADVDATRTVINAVKLADTVAWAVVTLALNLERAAGLSGDTDTRRDTHSEEFYALIDASFRQWLASYDVTAHHEILEVTWQHILNDAARAHARFLIANASASAWKGRESTHGILDVGQAEAWFRGALRKALPHVYATKQEPTAEPQGVQT